METQTSPLERKRPSADRYGATTKIAVANWELYVTMNFYENDQPAELFVVVGKEGTTISGLIRTISTFVSMMLQCGIPLSRITEKMEHSRFDPYDDQYKSLVDAISSAALRLASDRGAQPEKDYDGRKVVWQPAPKGDTSGVKSSPKPAAETGEPEPRGQDPQASQIPDRRQGPQGQPPAPSNCPSCRARV